MKTWPGLNSRGNVTKMQPPPVRDGIYYVGASNPMLQPDFWMPLNDLGNGQVSVLLAKGIGFATYSRASIATCRLQNGLLKKVLAGVPRSHYLANASYAGYFPEEFKTNILLRSEEFATAPWSLAGNTILTPNAAVAPDGTNTGWFLGETTNLASQFFISQLGGINGTIYNYTIFAKAGTTSWLRLEIGTGGFGAWFNLATGVVGTVSGGAVASIEAWNNGWYRCSLCRPMDAIQAFYAFAQSQDGQFAFNGTLGNGIYIWGSHAEVVVANTTGSSSYIPTAGATVTRAQDILTVPAANVPMNAPYSWYAEAALNFVDPTPANWQILLGSDVNYAPMLRVSAGAFSPSEFFSDTGIASSDIPITDVQKLLPNKYGAARGATEVEIFLNGVAGGPANFGAQPANATNIAMGCQGSVSQLNGFMKNVKGWRRELTDNDMKFITGF